MLGQSARTTLFLSKRALSGLGSRQLLQSLTPAPQCRHAHGSAAPHVVVVGGGPAGAVAGMCLAAHGISVTVFESTTQTGTKLGECLSPNCSMLLDRLELRHLLDNQRESAGFESVWGSPEVTEKDFIRGAHGHGWHLDRRQFEQDLAREASDRGVDWQSGVSVLSCERRNDDKWSITTSAQGYQGQNEVEADFLVLATGRKSAKIATQLLGSRIKLDDLIGVSRTFTLEDPILDTCMMIESAENGWWYTAPIDPHQVVATYMTDYDILKREVKLRSTEAHDLGSLLPPLPKKSLSRLHNCKIRGVSTAVTQRCGFAYSENLFGRGWLASGDAAVSYDPLSSYGITSAMGSGYYASCAILESLSGAEDGMQLYADIISESFAGCVTMTVQGYGWERQWPEFDFWKRRHDPLWMEELTNLSDASP